MNKYDKNSRWCYTAWEKPEFKHPELVGFQVEQLERSKEFHKHYQGYIEFLKPYSMGSVKSLFGTKKIHLEEAQQSKERNIMYCTKGDYLGYRYMYNGPTDRWYEEDTSLQPLTWGLVKRMINPEYEDLNAPE